jgi:hypothetical protein
MDDEPLLPPNIRLLSEEFRVLAHWEPVENVPTPAESALFSHVITDDPVSLSFPFSLPLSGPSFGRRHATSGEALVSELHVER